MKQYTKQYIAGIWREGTSEHTLTNCNPLTGEVLYSYRAASQQDVDEAYAAAAQAQEVWMSTPPAHKKEMMQKLGQVFAAKKDEMIDLLIEESGSTKAKYDYEFMDTLNVIKFKGKTDYH